MLGQILSKRRAPFLGGFYQEFAGPILAGGFLGCVEVGKASGYGYAPVDEAKLKSVSGLQQIALEEDVLPRNGGVRHWLFPSQVQYWLPSGLRFR